MRRAAKVDANQSDITSALRALGVSVQPLHMVGKGCPDLLCGYRGRNVLLEVKDGKKPPSARRLTDDESRWAASWNGQVAVVNCIADAISAVVDAARL